MAENALLRLYSNNLHNSSIMTYTRQQPGIHFFRKQSLLLFLFLPLFSVAQEKVALKTNLAGWAGGNINLSAELPVSTRFSVGLGGSYNPWEYKPASKLQHLLVRPEARYYPCRVFRKWFVGVQGLYGVFNAGGLDVPLFPTLRNRRYIGTMWGASAIGGYQFPISRHWSFETSIGLGYIHSTGDLHKLRDCTYHLGKKTKNYLGLTDLSFSFIYVF